MFPFLFCKQFSYFRNHLIKTWYTTQTNHWKVKARKTWYQLLYLCKASSVKSTTKSWWRSVNNNLSKLKSERSVTNKVNFLLWSRLGNMELQTWAVFKTGIYRYNRQSRWIRSRFFGEKNIFEKLGCDTPPNNIKACRRISKKSATFTVRFSRRKDCQQVLAGKKDLRKIKMEDVDLSGQNKLCINKNLCS